VDYPADHTPVAGARHATRLRDRRIFKGEFHEPPTPGPFHRRIRAATALGRYSAVRNSSNAEIASTPVMRILFWAFVN
jgi:hypothetical protein